MNLKDKEFLKELEFFNSKSWDEAKSNTWGISQADARRKGKLEKWKVDKLTEINFPWNHYMSLRDREFMNDKEFMSKLSDFLESREKKTIPSRKKKTKKEGRFKDLDFEWWCMDRAADRLEGSIEQWQIDELNKIDFPWAYYQEEWENWLDCTDMDTPIWGIWAACQKAAKTNEK